MNIKHNINYFKKNENLKFIGGTLLILGLFFLWFGPAIDLWFISYAVSPPVIVVGFVMFLIGSSGRSSEADLDDCIKRGTEGLEVYFDDDIHYGKRLLKHIAPSYIEGYEFHDGVMIKKGKNSSLRSSEYTKALIYIMSDRLYINRKTVCLVSDELKKDTTEILYDDIKNVEIVKIEENIIFEKKTFKTKSFRFTVNYGDGLVFSAPIFDNMDSVHLVETINRTITEYKKSKA